MTFPNFLAWKGKKNVFFIETGIKFRTNKRRGTRIKFLEMDKGGRRMASAWNTKKKSNSAMKEKELGDVTPSRKRTKRMKPAWDAGLTDEVKPRIQSLEMDEGK